MKVENIALTIEFGIAIYERIQKFGKFDSIYRLLPRRYIVTFYNLKKSSRELSWNSKLWFSKI